MRCTVSVTGQNLIKLKTTFLKLNNNPTMNKGRFPFNEQAFKFILHGWNRNVQMNTQLHMCCAGIDSGKRDQIKNAQF